MQRQAEKFGARTEYAEVEGVDLAASPKVLHTSEGTFQAKTVAFATGANPRELGLPEEASLVGRGVAYCAACDGMRYKDKTVVVSAAADALILSRIAKKVILVHRRDTLRATKVYHEPLMKTENLEFRWNSTVSALLHEEELTGVRTPSPGPKRSCPATLSLSASAASPPPNWRPASWSWTAAAISSQTSPPAPASPAFSLWEMCGPNPSARW